MNTMDDTKEITIPHLAGDRQNPEDSHLWTEFAVAYALAFAAWCLMAPSLLALKIALTLSYIPCLAFRVASLFTQWPDFINESIAFCMPAKRAEIQITYAVIIMGVVAYSLSFFHLSVLNLLKPFFKCLNPETFDALLASVTPYFPENDSSNYNEPDDDANDDETNDLDSDPDNTGDPIYSWPRRFDSCLILMGTWSLAAPAAIIFLIAIPLALPPFAILWIANLTPHAKTIQSDVKPLCLFKNYSIVILHSINIALTPAFYAMHILVDSTYIALNSFVFTLLAGLAITFGLHRNDSDDDF